MLICHRLYMFGAAFPLFMFAWHHTRHAQNITHILFNSGSSDAVTKYRVIGIMPQHLYNEARKFLSKFFFCQCLWWGGCVLCCCWVIFVIKRIMFFLILYQTALRSPVPLCHYTSTFNVYVARAHSPGTWDEANTP